METQQAQKDLQFLEQKTASLSQNLEQLWLEFNQQQEMLKLITSQNQYTISKKTKKFKMVIRFVIPYLELKQVFQMRFLSKEFKQIIAKEKKAINQLINHQIEKNKEKLYEFNIIDKTSRELYMYIVKLNFYGQKVKETVLPKDFQCILKQISDPSQIYAIQVASKFQYPQKKMAYQNPTQKEIIDNYCKIAYHPWQGNTNLVAEFEKYRKEILRQKHLKHLQSLRPVVDNL
ncbi:unnamed protein product (macronuclear) [Paramecium tetraurelia]|uniref:F-box domain-containing protein n=1 Tax=Paramecium tetraurelia TaxID=5888 RepID=A0CML4_PARTE|nr:uncharacterized protein GSPATT00008510001 [Paramecium tetraurelia]CAK72031.1 unnamed protein product [Paramecium tetraurelia]|eukprot:XP_001439428.1 hypothetical protein (macronuclear) [Paramecium tetraurelia strain d4-2]